MGYDLYLMDPKRQERARTDKPHNISGGTYQVGGTTELWIHITYNYAKHFQNTLGKRGIRTIYGMTGEESIPVLQAATDKLKDDVHEDYWKPTEGNAKKALLDCIELAKLARHGVWDGN